MTMGRRERRVDDFSSHDVFFRRWRGCTWCCNDALEVPLLCEIHASALLRVESAFGPGWA